MTEISTECLIGIIASDYGDKADRLMVKEINRESNALKSGLMPGDIIDGVLVGDHLYAPQSAIAGPSGTQLTLQVSRFSGNFDNSAAETVRIPVTLEPYEVSKQGDIVTDFKLQPDGQCDIISRNDITGGEEATVAENLNDRLPRVLNTGRSPA